LPPYNRDSTFYLVRATLHGDSAPRHSSRAYLPTGDVRFPAHYHTRTDARAAAHASTPAAPPATGCSGAAACTSLSRIVTLLLYLHRPPPPPIISTHAAHVADGRAAHTVPHWPRGRTRVKQAARAPGTTRPATTAPLPHACALAGATCPAPRELLQHSATRRAW